MQTTTRLLIVCFSIHCCATNLFAQAKDFSAVRAGVFFDNPLRTWDGFGFNYVETAHSYDMSKFNQEYGGFSLLDEQEKQEIVQLVFGEEGLKVGLVKMFLGANHQQEPGGSYDHESTTRNMRYFVKEGLKLTRQRGDDLQIITTLYGPPGFMTLQKANRGRDLDPKFKKELALYMIDWVKFLREEEQLPVKYLSLHNEGEDWHRWNHEGLTERRNHDYNLYWPVEQINEFLKFMPALLKEHGLDDVGMTPGEPSNWYRFAAWGLAHGIAKDTDAVNGLGLITSHGFYRGAYGHWFGEHNSVTNDLLREQRPGLHSWVTSTSWSAMDASFVKEIHGNIYTSKVNAIIPWAGIQRPTHWVGGDPNPGSAIKVDEDGNYEVRKGYYFYKQVSRAGQPGMGVAETFAMNSAVAVIGFSREQTDNADAFVVANLSKGTKNVSVQISGTDSKSFSAFITTSGDENFSPAGNYEVRNGAVFVEVPSGAVITFLGQ
ncbi:glycoside hydrolase [Novipirellula artificiosorum]|uniref:Glycosyl hydrolase family 30 beta sandwich domain-containing protein n=1 Tax=Novipirellula artificiosorum TaxID=2528016 RepID=A0A5C6D7C5_9BACT|nr:hypothetical protein [Novipirellula artificiosorum]TWU32832.1 hypothetical protein Poly41_52090 [Novipirellula artificiosorum]